MISGEEIKEVLCGHTKPSLLGNQILINTQCLYPSNAFVSVCVTGGKSTFVVSDKGEANRVAEEHGVYVPNVSRWLNHVSKNTNLKIIKDEICTPSVSLDCLPNAIMSVANTSAAAARYAIENYSTEKNKNFSGIMLEILSAKFGSSQIAKEIDFHGASNRTYTFDFMVGKASGDKILVDFVQPSRPSINAKAVSHIDVSRLDNKKVGQYLIFDKNQDWHSEDLIFLKTAAQLVPLDAMERSIGYQELGSR